MALHSRFVSLLTNDSFLYSMLTDHSLQGQSLKVRRPKDYVAPQAQGKYSHPQHRFLNACILTRVLFLFFCALARNYHQAICTHTWHCVHERS